MTQILVVEDEAVLGRNICSYLGKRGFSAEHVCTAAEGVEAFKRLRPAMTVLDYRLGGEDGLEVMRRLRLIDPAAQVVMVTGHGDVDVAVRAMKTGARDFLSKPVSLSSIAALASEIIGSATPKIRAETRGLERIQGRSGAITELRSGLKRILDAVSASAAQPPSLLISGETGAGKELVARALHEDGPRRAGPFVSVNCAALPAELVEAELFGYERGAFTDAKSGREGLFEAADGGILFLDEIGDMPLGAQAKLLRALEERAVRRVGSVTERPVDVWVIAATNRHLSDLTQTGAFRSDLMFRLQVLWIETPPLRERDCDILPLAAAFAAEAARRYGRATPRFSSEARARLVGHAWPGNVRELRNVVERALLLAEDAEIDAGAIRLDAPSRPAESDRRHASLRDLEVSALRQALVHSGGNVTRAADILGVSRDTLRYRMEKFGLKRDGVAAL